MFYIYVLKSITDKSWYIGFSANPKQRLLDHNSGRGCRSTIKKKWTLIYLEGYLDKKDALGREKFLKSGSGRRYLQKQLKNFLG